MTGCRRVPSLTTLSTSAPNPLFSKYSGFILFVTSGPHENGYPETENVAQLVACLPGGHKGLGSFLSTPCLHNPVWWHTPVISERQSSDKRIMSSGPSSITEILSLKPTRATKSLSRQKARKYAIKKERGKKRRRGRGRGGGRERGAY